MTSSRPAYAVCDRARYGVLASLGAVLLFAVSASAQESVRPTLPPPPPKVSIKSAEVIGNCKGTPTITPDRSNVQVKLNELVADVGGDKAVDLDNCVLVLSVDVPAGYEFAPTELHGSGKVTLAEGVSASLFAAASFAALDRTTHTLVFHGPTDRTFTIDAGFGGADGSFGPCGTNRPIYIDLSLSMRAHDEGEPGSIALTEISSLGFWVRPCTRR